MSAQVEVKILSHRQPARDGEGRGPDKGWIASWWHMQFIPRVGDFIGDRPIIRVSWQSGTTLHLYLGEPSGEPKL